MSDSVSGNVPESSSSEMDSSEVRPLFSRLHGVALFLVGRA